MAQSIENMKTYGSLAFDADDGNGRPCSFNPLLQRSVWQYKYSLSLLFETSTILWNGLNAHQIQYNGVKKWFQYIKQV